MVTRPIADKLLDLCYHHAHEIAESWYKDVSKNPRTPFFHKLGMDELVRWAETLYVALKDIYFLEDTYFGVISALERTSFVHRALALNAPMSEVLYALVLMRRHIWLYADLQALFMNAMDMLQGMNSVNRILVVFDYASYIVLRKFEESKKR